MISFSRLIPGPHVQVPSSLDSISHRAGEADASAAGLSARKVAAIASAFDDIYRSGAYPGAAVCIRRRGHVILHRSIGYARGAPMNGKSIGPIAPLLPETPICLFSASKAITAVLVHMLAEDGGIDLDDSVDHYLPKFGKNGKSGVTISDVLAHRGGFPEIPVPKAERRVEALLDWDGIIERICNAEAPMFRPTAYHAISGGFILGEIIQKVTGMTIQQYLDKKIRQPMGMRYFTFGLAPSERDSVALNYEAGMPVTFPLAPLIERALMVPFGQVVNASNSNAFMDAVIPAGNCYATAEELSRFFQMLLDGGVWQGQRLIERKTLARAVLPIGRMLPDATLAIPMHYSEGFMLGGPMSLYGPRTTGAYGHLGFMSILGWADPRRDLAASLLLTGKAVLGPHLLPWMRFLAVLGQACR